MLADGPRLRFRCLFGRSTEEVPTRPELEEILSLWIFLADFCDMMMTEALTAGVQLDDLSNCELKALESQRETIELAQRGNATKSSSKAINFSLPTLDILALDHS
ncbi:hypothetical protein OIDMADRAFT_178838 [Oidiodendron maius Zn]|uniref:Uncharacterized protein n=1 Tax=Oidiodendron maius (strain Zn) TaxID=913774 RepID=A0A0C3CVZ7_OIDMZ|nr:hypothetical protein OIDMADRAFT_178838 [Oidiodendron maius Zn]